MASSRLTNEEYYLFQKLFREAIGTDQIGYGGDSAYSGLTEGLAKTLGMAASTNSIQEIRKADCILLIGVDPAATHPIIKNEIHLAIRRNRAQLIVLGSHDIGLSRATQISPMFHPSVTLTTKPGMEVSLLNAMIGTLLREGLEDKGFIKERTQGIEELIKKMAASDESLGTLPEAKKIEIEKAARAFAQAKKAMILIGSGLWSHVASKEVATAASNLALITGHIGKESSGILILLDKCNAQGAIDIGEGVKGSRVGMETLPSKGRGRKAEGCLYRRRKPSHYLFRCSATEESPGKPSMSYRSGPLYDGDRKDGPCCPPCKCFCGKERNVHQPGAEGSEVESSSPAPKPVKTGFRDLLEPVAPPRMSCARKNARGHL